MHIKMNSVKKLSFLGVFVALAMIFSYIEFLIPSFIPIPGFKLGLSNIPVILVLFIFGPVEAFLVGIVKVILSALLFGNIYSFVLSFSGIVLCLLAASVFYRLDKFSVIGISLLAGFFHNTGQIISASLLMHSFGLLKWFFVFAVLGLFTGILTGFICKYILTRVHDYDWISKGDS